MAGFYETMLGNLSNLPVQSYVPTTASVFGNTIATPTRNQAGVNKLQKAVNTANNAVTKAQKAYDKYAKKAPVMSDAAAAYAKIVNAFGGLLEPSEQKYGNKTTGYRYTGNSKLANEYYKYQADLAAYNDKLANLQSNLKSAQNTLSSKKSALSDYKTKMKSETDAVNWGLSAKNAEQQGISDAAQMYQDTMQNEARRNAIMNAAVGTIGNFGAIGNLGTGGVR